MKVKRLEKTINVVIGKPLTWAVYGLWLAATHGLRAAVQVGKFQPASPATHCVVAEVKRLLTGLVLSEKKASFPEVAGRGRKE